ncbi:MAG: hypothetical protein DMF44_12930 [Verrucomicrobia bacterium]|nr:MAG: hypothetical protein DMF44_12930 [Verrucomicrobiota bacterium]
MYLLTNSRGLRLAAQESLAAIFALSVAETFYRFHSFTLECLAFLATWYGVSWALNKARKFGHQTDMPRHVRRLRHHKQMGPAGARPSEIGGVLHG